MNTPDVDAVTAIAQLAEQAAGAEELKLGGYYVFRTPQGGVQTVDLTGDFYLSAPKRKHGVVVVRDAPSFLAYWAKHSDPGSEVYADRSKLAVTAVLDAHQADGARFGGHRLVLQLRHSDQFSAWYQRSGQPHAQVQFAEFIEDHRSDVRVPAAAELLELAQTFQATTKAVFKSSNVLKSGQRQLEFTEQIDASAGRTGQLSIPDEFELALPIFDGAEVADRVVARLRYRIQNSGLQMIFILDQINDAINAAFEGVVDDLAGTTEDGGVGVPILRGTPA